MLVRFRRKDQIKVIIRITTNIYMGVTPSKNKKSFLFNNINSPTHSPSECFADAKRNTVVIFAHAIVNTDIYFFGGQHFEAQSCAYSR